MEVLQKISCLVLLVFGFVQTSVLPVEKCTLSDKSCLAAAIQKMVPIFMAGIPEDGTEVLDVMEMDFTKFDLSGLQFSLADGTLKGLKNAVIENAEWDAKKKVCTIEFHTDASVKGHYTASGHVLILPITGDGQFKLKMKNVYIKLFFNYEIVKIGDKEHIKPTKYGFEFDIRDGAHFHLTNLFNGNKELSDAMLLFLNENWKQIAGEFGNPLVNTAAKKIFKNIIKYFESNELNEIATV